MKKTMVFMLVLAMTLSLTACRGAGSITVSENATLPKPSKTPSSMSTATPESVPLETDDAEPDMSPTESTEIKPDIPLPVEGLIAINIDKSVGWYRYNGASCQKTTVTLTAIDTTTGQTQDVRTFTNSDTLDFTINGHNSIYNVPYSLQRFDSDFNRLVAEKTMPDGSRHVGWVDTNGVFTDVSAMLTAPAGDFGGLTKHSLPYFGIGSYFYYVDESGEAKKVFRVPLDNLMQNAQELIQDDMRTDYSIQPDGSVAVNNLSYSDISMQYPAARGEFCEWIDETTFIGISFGDGLLYKYTALPEDEWWGTQDYADRISIVPEVVNRVNNNAVVSPDKTTVAFLSRLLGAADNAPYLFLVPVDGGEPQKINTSYVFRNGTQDDAQLGFSMLLVWR